MGSFKRLLLAVVLLCAVPSVLAQVPPAPPRDDRTSTMRVLVDPDASELSEVVRKIPPPKSRRSGETADARARDLANPRSKGEQDATGSAADPGHPFWRHWRDPELGRPR